MQDIIINPGDRVLAVTGLSPISKSFMVNKCSGYLSQDRYFTQYLPQNCPRPKLEEIPIVNLDKKNECYDYLSYIPSCTTPRSASFPDPLSPDQITSECKAFIQSYFTYDSCVALHESSKDFYSREWRIYLGANTNLWQERHDKIELVNKAGKVVATYEY